MKKHIILLLFLCFSIINTFSQVILNGTIDGVDEMIKKDSVYMPTSDGTLLATDIYLPVFQDSVVMPIEIGGDTFQIQIIPRNCQFIIYDTTNITPDSYSLPTVFMRTPYNKTGDDLGNTLFPFMGYGFANQDMRGRYSSEGVYFPMYSDAWPKIDYHPGITIPMDITSPSDPNNALKHHDGSESINYLADSVFRIADVDLDGDIDTIHYNNGSIGMFGASAMGNSQYQAISDIPFTQSSPLKCLMPVVATNEHYNTTLFHNGVYRNSIANGWITGQMTNGVDDGLSGSDPSIFNTIHSPADYNYSSSSVLAEDLINWFVAEKPNGSLSGAHPTSLLRKDLDASLAPINSSGLSDPNGTISRYRNINRPIYHLTGWWDIFINGQIETYRRIKKEHPNLEQKLVIGPWTHQTIGNTDVGDVVYPDNVTDILSINLDIDPSNITSTDIVNEIYSSEMLAWYRKHLGGEPFFIIPESNLWQDLGGDSVRVPSENYIVPYYEFLNFAGGQSSLNNLPSELKSGGNITPINYNIPALSPSIINLSEPLTPIDTSILNETKDIRMYISGPTNDPNNNGIGNYWRETDSLPFYAGIQSTKLYLHKDQSLNGNSPSANEGDLSYISDPNNPVYTIGGNNMIPEIPGGGQDSQGSMNLANPAYNYLTMDRVDVLSFETEALTDTLSVIGFPKAEIYAKGNTTAFATSKTDFDVMVRILDVYPDGREMLITEGVVNAKARDYATSIYNADTNETIVLSNIENDTYHYFNFDLLPIGHTFGKQHKIKILLSSSNYPKYQSNPNIPNEAGEFFRWSPGSTDTYDYNGQQLSAQNSEITYNFNQNYPSFISLPQLTQNNASLSKNVAKSDFIKVYPIPTSDIITIKTPQPYTGDIQLLDLSGKTIQTKSIINKSTINWDLERLEQGIYLIHFPAIQATKKIIIE